ncbi:hypothetical protein AB0G73_18795 [Streptomyces sp. NPDC020719]|uniref:hypothetical protein n=1 Tax=Streptomyces sp. NPDC020719 TaxID=3154896 RepID=UPI0033F8EE4D
MPHVSTPTVEAVFAAAVRSPHWIRTNLGQQVSVTHGSYHYTVRIHSSRRYLDHIEIRDGYGGYEYLKGLNATPAQHRALAAVADHYAP